MVEPRFPVRLVALDIDGTLVGADLALRDRTVEAVRAATHRGVIVTLVTGRMTSSARDFAEVLGLIAPIIGHQGAVVREMPAPGAGHVGRLLRHHAVPVEVAREAIVWSRARGMDPHLNHLDRLIVRADDPRADDYSRFLGVRAVLPRDLVAWVTRPVTKVVAVADEPKPVEAIGPARAAFDGRAAVTVSHPRFLEFVAPDVSKGATLHWLARRLGVSLSQTLAIGDQYGDLEMIADVGHGVAMPHAPEPVRAAARLIAPPLADEGAAQVIEELVLRHRGDRHDPGKAPRAARSPGAHARRARL